MYKRFKSYVVLVGI